MPDISSKEEWNLTRFIWKCAPIVTLLIATAQAAPAPAVAYGRALYRAHCMTCHLADGRGGVRFSRVVSADLRAPGLERTYRGEDALIVRAILHGIDQHGKPLHAPMPHWAGTLSVAQADEVVAYLHTLKAAR